MTVVNVLLVPGLGRSLLHCPCTPPARVVERSASGVRAASSSKEGRCLRFEEEGGLYVLRMRQQQWEGAFAAATVSLAKQWHRRLDHKRRYGGAARGARTGRGCSRGLPSVAPTSRGSQVVAEDLSL